jgi:hypothetical protein
MLGRLNIILLQGNPTFAKWENIGSWPLFKTCVLSDVFAPAVQRRTWGRAVHIAGNQSLANVIRQHCLTGSGACGRKSTFLSRRWPRTSCDGPMKIKSVVETKRGVWYGRDWEEKLIRRAHDAAHGELVVHGPGFRCCQASWGTY